MAVLTAEDIRVIAKAYIQEAYRVTGDICDLTKDDIEAAVQPTEDWITTNEGSFNSDLPLPFRTTATAVQKTILFAQVAYRRAGLI